MPTSPWITVFGLIRDVEDGLALMALFEYRDPELLANGRSLSDVLDGAYPGERGVADAIAQRMRQLEGGDWDYIHFYGPTRDSLRVTDDEVRDFVRRCGAAGVRLHYDDGTDP